MEWRSAVASDGFEELIVIGDCDLYAAPVFASAVLARLYGGSRRLRIDLSRVGYMDSTGVGAIIRMLRAAKSARAELRFKGISGSPRKVLRMSNILPLLPEDGAEGADR